MTDFSLQAIREAFGRDTIPPRRECHYCAPDEACSWHQPAYRDPIANASAYFEKVARDEADRRVGIRRGPAAGAVYADGKYLGEVVDVDFKLSIDTVPFESAIAKTQLAFYEHLLGRTPDTATGPALDRIAEEVFGLSRGPDETDADLRARVLDQYRALSPRPKQEAKMPHRNPYDRRDTEPRHEELSRGGAINLGDGRSFDMLADGKAAYKGFGLARLETLLRDEFAHGFNAGEATLERRLDEEILPRVRRLTWAEGHRHGMADGRSGLLEQIDEQVGAKVRETQDLLAGYFDKLDPAEAWDQKRKQEVMTLLAGASEVLQSLVVAHHREFAGDIPF